MTISPTFLKRYRESESFTTFYNVSVVLREESIVDYNFFQYRKKKNKKILDHSITKLK